MEIHLLQLNKFYLDLEGRKVSLKIWEPSNEELCKLMFKYFTQGLEVDEKRDMFDMEDVKDIFHEYIHLDEDEFIHFNDQDEGVGLIRAGMLKERDIVVLKCQDKYFCIEIQKIE